MACVIVEFCSNGFAAPVCSEAAEFGRNESAQLCEIVLWVQSTHQEKKHTSRGGGGALISKQQPDTPRLKVVPDKCEEPNTQLLDVEA